MRLLEFWRPFRIVTSRRISEEEQVSVEAFSRDLPEAKDRLAGILEVFRDHRKRSNEEVVRATTVQLAALDAAIKQRGETIHELNESLERVKAECRKFDEILAGKRKRVEERFPLHVVPGPAGGPTSQTPSPGANGAAK